MQSQQLELKIPDNNPAKALERIETIAKLLLEKPIDERVPIIALLATRIIEIQTSSQDEMGFFIQKLPATEVAKRLECLHDPALNQILLEHMRSSKPEIDTTKNTLEAKALYERLDKSDFQFTYQAAKKQMQSKKIDVAGATREVERAKSEAEASRARDTKHLPRTAASKNPTVPASVASSAARSGFYPADADKEFETGVHILLSPQEHLNPSTVSTAIQDGLRKLIDESPSKQAKEEAKKLYTAYEEAVSPVQKDSRGRALLDRERLTPPQCLHNGIQYLVTKTPPRLQPNVDALLTKLHVLKTDSDLPRPSKT